MKENFYAKLLERNNAPGLFAATNGIRLTRCWEDYAEGELTVSATSMNPRGIVHGGCLFALMDNVAGVAAASSGRACVTLNSTMNYIKAVKPGTKKILCQTSKVKSGRTIAVFNSVLTDDEGSVIASGTYTYFLMEELQEYLDAIGEDIR